MEQENIYEWLYDHYCRPQLERARDPFAPHIRAAEQLLLTGGGTPLAREDALNLCLDSAAIPAFAAGIGFCYHLLADGCFPAH